LTSLGTLLRDKRTALSARVGADGKISVLITDRPFTALVTVGVFHEWREVESAAAAHAARLPRLAA
jgi:hypothetical protein